MMDSSWETGGSQSYGAGVQNPYGNTKGQPTNYDGLGGHNIMPMAWTVHPHASDGLSTSTSKNADSFRISFFVMDQILVKRGKQDGASATYQGERMKEQTFYIDGTGCAFSGNGVLPMNWANVKEHENTGSSSSGGGTGTGTAGGGENTGENAG